MPKIPKSANKAKARLWPEEDAKLASCAKVDVSRRIAYGVRTYIRHAKLFDDNAAGRFF